MGERKGTAVYVHPAVQAIDDMVSQYGGQWPPRPSFEDWPPSWKAIEEIADDMREVCYRMNNPDEFRQWMRQQLDEKVNLPEVMKEVRRRMSTDDPVFLGFLAPLSYMVNLYRWGTIPPTDKERMRTTLDFPEAIWTPFSTVSNYWGVVLRGCTFGLNVCNCCYDDPENPDRPTDMRFNFNYLPEQRNSEKNFFMSFLDMENTFRPGLFAVREFLLETEAARKSRDYAEKILARRLELLAVVRQTIVKVSRVFTRYMKERMVDPKYWADYVQAMPAWNMNGVDGGASGGESLTFHCLDEFLGTFGDGVIYKGGLKKREGIPFQYNRVLDALHEHGHEYRFQSFLGHSPEEDPVQKARDEVIQMLYTWRLGHAKVAPRYLVNSRMTAGGSVDKALVDGDTLAKRGEFELRERARETVSCLATRKPPKVVQAHIDKMKDGRREQELQELLQGSKDSSQGHHPPTCNAASKAMQKSYLSKTYELASYMVGGLLSKLVPWY